jgi:hypothetical protein
MPSARCEAAGAVEEGWTVAAVGPGVVAKKADATGVGLQVRQRNLVQGTRPADHSPARAAVVAAAPQREGGAAVHAARRSRA